ncbi:MAG TPA: tRNA lysidine(34) synthetase TilS [Pyrinomonadaceae bacterium]|nr:tRNA lysidine(34) synthetase TilS [Pyrinomonadaceae bacterium]
MHKFVRSLITEWRKLELPFDDASIVVAVSGGADSMSLVTALHDLTVRKKLRLRILVAHFNHGLRGAESDADEEFVRNYAEQFGFEFRSGSGKITRRGNLEQNARDSRYKFLSELAVRENANQVLTAHTLNDQAETLLINLIRGSGPEGLAGMKQMRQLNNEVLLARPLLGWARREETESFCRDFSIEYRSDTMNDDLAFTRVRVRKSIIPALAEINPRIVETLARTADLIGNKSNHDASKVRQSPSAEALELKSLRLLAKPDLYSALRSWIRERRGNLRSIQLKHIDAIERLIHSRKSGNTVEIPGHGAVVKRGGMLVFTNLKVEK